MELFKGSTYMLLHGDETNNYIINVCANSLGGFHSFCRPIELKIDHNQRGGGGKRVN